MQAPLNLTSLIVSMAALAQIQQPHHLATPLRLQQLSLHQW